MEVFRLELGNVVSLVDVVEGEIVENQLKESSEVVLI